MDYTELLTKTQAEIDERFTSKKIRSDYLADIYDLLQLNKKADLVRGCGTFLEWHISDVRSKLVHANFCKDRLCPMCSWRRSVKVFRQVSQCLDFMESEHYQYLFLTLTLKNCSDADLVKTIDLLNSAKAKLFRRAKIQKFLKGAFCTLEITRNWKTGEWHPHLHCLLAVRSDYFKKHYVKHSEWCLFWQECAKLDYSPVVDIRRVKSADLEQVSSDLELKVMAEKKAIREVSKYSVKDSQYLTDDIDLDKKLVSLLVAALKKRRFVSFSGCFEAARKALCLDDSENGDLVHLDNQLRPEMLVAIVRYHWVGGVYVRKVVSQEITPFDSPPLIVNTGFVKERGV